MSSVREIEMSLDLGFGENRALLQIQRGPKYLISGDYPSCFFGVFLKASIHGKIYLKPRIQDRGNRASRTARTTPRLLSRRIPPPPWRRTRRAIAVEMYGAGAQGLQPDLVASNPENVFEIGSLIPQRHRNRVPVDIHPHISDSVHQGVPFLELWLPLLTAQPQPSRKGRPFIMRAPSYRAHFGAIGWGFRLHLSARSETRL
jgi:hypothetical protein